MTHLLIFRDLLFFFLYNPCNLYLAISFLFFFQIHKYHGESDSLLQGYETKCYISKLQVVEALLTFTVLRLQKIAQASVVTVARSNRHRCAHGTPV